MFGEIIEKIGHIEREVDSDLFSSVIHHIIGQQILTKAQATIWRRMKEQFGEVTAGSIVAADIPELQSFGMTFRWGAVPGMRDYAPKKGVNRGTDRTNKRSQKSGQKV